MRRSSEFLGRSASNEATSGSEYEHERIENVEKTRLLQHFYIDDNERLSTWATRLYEEHSNKGHTFTSCCEKIKENYAIYYDIKKHVSNRIQTEYLTAVASLYSPSSSTNWEKEPLFEIETTLRKKYLTYGSHITAVIHQHIYQKLNEEVLETSWLHAWSVLEKLKKTYSEGTVRGYFFHIQSIHDDFLCEFKIEDNETLCKMVTDFYFEQASQGKSDEDIKASILGKNEYTIKIDEHIVDRMATEYAELFDNGESRETIEEKLRAKYPVKIEERLKKARYKAHLKEHFTYKNKLKFNLNVEAIKHEICTEPSKCTHPYHHFWEGVYVCWDCWEKLNDTPDKERKYAHILSRERARMMEIKDDPIPEGLSEEKRQSYIGELSAKRGIKIGFFEALVKEYNLWDYTTHDLIRLIVKPLTEKSRCRFVELDAMAEHTGPAETFCSYAQKGRLGDVVAAFRDGNADPNRCIWFDAFSVRQWPSQSPDLDFKSTIAHCKSFLAVCSRLDEVEMICNIEMITEDVELSFDAKSKICFLRVWCLVEAHQACTMPDMPYIMKCGNYVIEDGMTKFQTSSPMLHNLRYLVDIEHAEASVPSDKERILEDIRNDPAVTVETLNQRIEMVISAAEGCAYDKYHSVIASAACGDERALEVVLMDPEAAIHAAFCGFKVLLEKALLQSKCDLSLTDSLGRTALICAALHGHSNCAKVIIEKDRRRVYDKCQHVTVLMEAAYHGHAECLEVLLQYIKDIDESIIHMTDPDHDNDTAIDYAFIKDHHKCVEILQNYGAEVSSHRCYH